MTLQLIQYCTVNLGQYLLIEVLAILLPLNGSLQTQMDFPLS